MSKNILYNLIFRKGRDYTMNLKIENELGSIELQEDILKTLAGVATTECYGVVGMASQHIFRDGLAEMLGQENYHRGIVMHVVEGVVHLDLYVVISYGVRMSEVVREIQKKVKYDLEASLKIEVGSVNVYIQDVQK